MTSALGIASMMYVESHSEELKENSRKWRTLAVSSFLLLPVFDIIATLTLVILGALALFNVASFSPVVAWSLLGAGAIWGILALPNLIFASSILRGL